MFCAKVQEISQPFPVVIVSVYRDISLSQNYVELSQNIFWNRLHLVTSAKLYPVLSCRTWPLMLQSTTDKKCYSKNIFTLLIPNFRI